DTLPESISFIAASGGGTATGHVVRWSLPSIAVGGRDSIYLTARVDDAAPAGTVRTRASVICQEGSDAVSDAVVEITGFIATTLDLTATPGAIIGNGRDSAAL